MKHLILVGVLIAVASPAHAQSRCTRPYAPTVNVSAATSTADLARIGADIRSFIAASDIYQTCLTSRLQTAESQRLVTANQTDKQRVANLYNAALQSRR
ncbi:MAG: hypothetical protein Q8K99_09380 [Actinomycetota bacterium]|nr:hypothetical protein [Actinomycetota bacterium]